MKCAKCNCEHDRQGQSYCRACHNAYKREHYVKVERKSTYNSKYKSDEERKAARRLRGKRSYWVHLGGISVKTAHAIDDEEPIKIPPEVKLRQQRRIERMTRALTMDKVTQNQYWLGDPVASLGKGILSLSMTEICAMLG